MAKILIVGRLDGGPTPFDGQWVVEYDPARPGVDPEGRPLNAYLITTPDPDEALDLPTTAAAEEYWKQSYGVRPDGRPNRPLTAFIVSIRPAGAAPGMISRRQVRANMPLLTFVAEFRF